MTTYFVGEAGEERHLHIAGENTKAHMLERESGNTKITHATALQFSHPTSRNLH